VIDKNKKIAEAVRGEFLDALSSVVFVASKLKEKDTQGVEMLLKEAKDMGLKFLELESDLKLFDIAQHMSYVAQTGSATFKNVVEPNEIVQHVNYDAQTGLLRHQDGTKSSDIVRRMNHVVQCQIALIYQIKNLINILLILKTNNFDKVNTLLAYRNLLRFESSIYDFSKTNFKDLELQKKNSKNGGELNVKKPVTQSPQNKIKLNDTKREILKHMERQGKSVLNKELFDKFSNISKRNIKRNMKELIDDDLVSRKAEGKKVYYRLK